MADLAFLEAVAGITDTKGRYCHCLDTKDWQGYGDCFTDDVVLDTRPAGGNITHGREELLRIVRYSVETARTAHHVHTPIITMGGDDKAHVIWAMQDRVVWGPERVAAMGNYGHTGYGHYTETYVKQDGRWRIAHQVLSRLHVDWHSAPAP